MHQKNLRKKLIPCRFGGMFVRVRFVGGGGKIGKKWSVTGGGMGDKRDKAAVRKGCWI